jgi:hypothetical protein
VLQKQFIPLRQDNHEGMHKILWVIARKLLSPTTLASQGYSRFRKQLEHLTNSLQLTFIYCVVPEFVTAL